MRLYYGSSIARVLSSLTAIAALGLVGLLGWKAFETWQSDPTLLEIQEILQRQQ